MKAREGRDDTFKCARINMTDTSVRSVLLVKNGQEPFIASSGPVHLVTVVSVLLGLATKLIWVGMAYQGCWQAGKR